MRVGALDHNGITEGSYLESRGSAGLLFPIWMGTFFQRFYSTADAMIVGRFLGTSALAAVGATSSIVSLLVGFFVATGQRCVGGHRPVLRGQGSGAAVRQRPYGGDFGAGIGAVLYDSWHRHRTDDSQDYADTPGHYGRRYGIYSGVLYGYDPANAL